jgi:hypothetical protein
LIWDLDILRLLNEVVGIQLNLPIEIVQIARYRLRSEFSSGYYSSTRGVVGPAREVVAKRRGVASEVWLLVESQEHCALQLQVLPAESSRPVRAEAHLAVPVAERRLLAKSA